MIFIVGLKVYKGVNMTLNDVKKSGSYTVLSVNIGGSLGQRLFDLGLCPGTEVFFVRSAPLFDPIHVRIGGYHIALRRSEAQFVEVACDAR